MSAYGDGIQEFQLYFGTNYQQCSLENFVAGKCANLTWQLIKTKLKLKPSWEKKDVIRASRYHERRT